MLKYRKQYIKPISGDKDDDYWLELTWVGHTYDSCMMIPEGISSYRVRGNEPFFLLSMNKKRDALFCYKEHGREKMFDFDGR
jgi:hypothetical protein